MKSTLAQLGIATLFCLAAVVGYGFWYAALAAKSSAAAELESAIRTKTETVNRIAATQMAIASIAKEEAAVRSYFVPETGVVVFIDTLQAQGKKQGAAVSVLSVSTGGEPERPALSLSLSVRGTFQSVMRTVGAIEYVPYDLSISGLTLTQDAKNSWHADLTVLVGSLPPANAATDTPAATTSSLPTHVYF